jgi:hypothetical protein
MKPMKIPTFILLINAQATICQNANVDNNKSTLSKTEYPQSKSDDNTHNMTISKIDNVDIQNADKDIRDTWKSLYANQKDAQKE